MQVRRRKCSNVTSSTVAYWTHWKIKVSMQKGECWGVGELGHSILNQLKIEKWLELRGYIAAQSKSEEKRERDSGKERKI